LKSSKNVVAGGTAAEFAADADHEEFSVDDE
jgi:hypothetical protein